MTKILSREEFDPDAKVPLEGIRVLDLSRLVSGNMVTHVLADYGADVVKIEKPGLGDDLRNWTTDGVSTHWKVYCRNKKSISLDLRKVKGREILLKLVERFDVLVENFKPGTLEKWGLGPDVLQEKNPKLTVVRISGWGQTGPWSHKPGFGSLVEAMSGFAAMNGFEQIAKQLILSGADVNSIDDEYWTPLNCAMWKGKGIINIKLSKKKKVIELLIRNGGKLSELTNH